MTQEIVVWSLGLVCLAFLANFWLTPWGVLALKRQAAGEIQVDLRPWYRPADLRRLLERYGPTGRKTFRRMLLVDMAFPAFYAAFFAALALAAPASPMAQPAVGLAVLAALMDYAENACLLAVLARWPAFDDHLPRLAARFTAAKVSTMAATVVLVTLMFAFRPSE